MFEKVFIDAFIEMYNVFAALILIFLIGQILFRMHSLDKDTLKARLFLNESIMQRMWLYISVSGAAFSLNTLIKLTARFTSFGKMLDSYYMVDLTQIIFLVSFILAVHDWYMFTGEFGNKKEDNSGLRRNWIVHHEFN